MNYLLTYFKHVGVWVITIICSLAFGIALVSLFEYLSGEARELGVAILGVLVLALISALSELTYKGEK